MSNTRNFADFDSPDSSTSTGTNEAGVLTTDTLETWREKTNGIIEKLKNFTGADLADNTVALGKITQLSNKKVLGNVSGGTANAAEVSIITEADKISSNDNDTSIPTSAAVNDLVSNRQISCQVGTSSQNGGASGAEIVLPLQAANGVSVSKVSRGTYDITVSSSHQLDASVERYIPTVSVALAFGEIPQTGEVNTIQNVYYSAVYQSSDNVYRVILFEMESFKQDFSDDANNCAMMSVNLRDIPFNFIGIPGAI